MTVKVQRWGNSLGLRISKVLAKGAHLRDGSEVDLQLEKGRIVVVPVRPRRRYDLETLLAGYRPEHFHGEVDVDAPVGKEVW